LRFTSIVRAAPRLTRSIFGLPVVDFLILGLLALLLGAKLPPVRYGH
jgi:hypothetical protein